MISKFFIERPIFANVIALVTVLVGAVFLYGLPVAQYPEIVPPTIQVATRYPGASAEVVAATIGVPLEQAINGVENSIYMSSTSSSDGSYLLTITFDVGTDLDTSLALVQNLANTALAQLPGGVTAQGITVRKVSPNILLVASLYSDDDRYDETFFSNYALINLQNPLARIQGVGQVRIFGAGPYSMRVWLDPQRLQSFGLTADDVLTAIRGQNVEVVAGQLGAPPVPEDQPFQFTINALGRLSDATQFENITIKSAGGTAPQLVRLRDVGRVELSQQSFSNFSRFTGRKAAQIVVFSLPGANAIQVADRVYRAMADMARQFPEGMKYAIRYDTTRFVREAISAVYHTLFIAAVLVLVVILLFLQNFRGMLVPATTVPVTIVGAFIAMAGLGFTINLMTLFALILAIGIVVDDAIIIVENSSYYIEQGMPPKEATIRAMEELTGPVMGITLALVAVFLPAAFLPGITGQIFRQFALVIAATSVISAINALTLKPVQCALWLRPRGNRRRNWFYRGFNRAFEAVTKVYIGVVARMVKHPLPMILLFAVIVGVTAWVFVRQPSGFLPTEDQGYAVLVSILPEGASQPRSRAVADKISAILEKTPGLAGWVTIGGFSVLDFANVPNVSTTFLVYQDWSERGRRLTQDRIVSGLNRDLSGIQEALAFVVIPPPIRGLGQTGGFQMMVEDRRSLGLTELSRYTAELVQKGNATPGLRGLAATFSTRSPQVYLNIDRTKAESLQVLPSSIFNALQAYLGSSFVNLFNKFNQVFQVYIQADNAYRLQAEDLRNLYVRNQNGDMVPLNALIQIRQTQGTELLTRYNLYPAASIFGSAAPGYSSGQALATMERLAAETLPEGMAYDWTSTSFQEKKVGSQAYLIYALSIVLVYMVLAALYESWTSPAAVVLVVPIALVGVLLAQLIRGYDNNLYTQVGLVLMIALASKNAILIVEFARDLNHRDGLPIREAAVEATRRRFRPIVMTSFAFILGVVPLVAASGAGAASQQAIGTVVFGGMMASTLLAIPFVPVFYVALEGITERMRRHGRPEHDDSHPQPHPPSRPEAASR
ncbi:MAG TPA: multidrug efflux RND transporter permease subunit [Methylomirabilota bacterium]|nr:multidrug efflux RND transporter permease subunit [Methylomirabilota bacterium]